MTDQYTELRQALEYLDSFCDPFSAAYEDASSRVQGLSAHFAPSLLAECDRLREALQMATDALADGLWDYGPGQDEHDKCNEVIAHCREALKEQQ